VRFLPSPGRITRLETPAGPYVRDDSGVYPGAEISVYYDPLISKLVAWAETREAALDRMLRALSEYVIRGIKTNLAFHRRVLRHPAFRRGEYDTSFIERHKPELVGEVAVDEELQRVALVAAAIDAARTTVGVAAPRPATVGGAWSQAVRWRHR
jgi:acetyl-CoA carboxylase biotin carboxylase subunit